MAMATDRRVLFYGDSFVAGAGDPDGLGWVGRLAAASAAAGVPITPYNLGVRHETSVDVARRWRDEARPRMVPVAEYRLVLSVGANDTTLGEEGHPRVEHETSVERFAAILREAVDIGLSPLAVGSPPAGDQAQRDRLRSLADAFASESERLGVPFVPVQEALGRSADWTAEAEHGDGVHPAAGGYGALAGLVFEAGWLDWLRGTRA
jgi:acyl-CoA thioesterase I